MFMVEEGVVIVVLKIPDSYIVRDYTIRSPENCLRSCKTYS